MKCQGTEWKAELCSAAGFLCAISEVIKTVLSGLLGEWE